MYKEQWGERKAKIDEEERRVKVRLLHTLVQASSGLDYDAHKCECTLGTPLFLRLMFRGQIFSVNESLLFLLARC